MCVCECVCVCEDVCDQPCMGEQANTLVHSLSRTNLLNGSFNLFLFQQQFET